jgi:TolB-like protein/DNA-binding winged helix-turn-helix (wHTH) protein/Tfp pilus assembly protein PilF
MNPPDNAVLRIGALRVDPALDEICTNGTTIKLEPRTMRLLVCLAEHAGQVVSVEQLLDQVWKDVVVSPDSVYQAIAALRRILGDDPKEPTYIATVMRRGYRLVAPVAPWVDTRTTAAASTDSAPTEAPPSETVASGSPTDVVATQLHRSTAMTGSTRSRYQRPSTALFAIGALALTYFLSQRLWVANHSSSSEGQIKSATRGVSDKSVAVLPFVNISGDKTNEYFSDGLSEELIDMLTQIPDLRVPARTSSFYFKGKQATIADIAKALGVAHVLEGSVRKSGNTIRITAQLVRVDNGYHVWSKTFDRQLDDIFKVQDEIAGSVVKALKVSLLEGAVPRATTSANSEAYTLYLQGQAMSFSSTSPAEDQRAVDYLRQSLKLDPKFAPAWAELANTLAADFSTFGIRPYEETRAQAHEAADHALTLDPTLPLGHIAMGRLLYQIDWSWDAAEAELKRAISLEPGNSEAHRLLAYIAITRGRFDDAIELLNRAIAIDPLQPWNYVVTGFATYRSGRLAAAEAAYRKALDLAPSDGKVHYLLGSVLLVRGQ